MPQPPPPGTPLTIAATADASLSVRASALIFADPASRAVLELVRQVAPSDASVLITGETGTGKELIARHLHSLSGRAAGPFQAINCGAFPEQLVESELFGHEAGTFTGSQGARSGWFEAAHRGTLFLDEIGDLPLAMQVKLLRVLQEREVVRLGSRKPIPVDVRLVAATNVDLDQAVASGRFRADLLYRLKVINIPVPPLRGRPGDILPLAEYFLDRYCQRLQVTRELGPESMSALLAYPWPGNIRELENVIHRAVLISRQPILTAVDVQLPAIPLPPQPAALAADTAPEASAEQALGELIAVGHDGLHDWVVGVLVRQAYAHCHGNQVRAAEALGLSRNVLRTLMKRHGLLAGDGRAGRVTERRRADLSPSE